MRGNSKVMTAMCIVAGSFFLYCGQSAMQAMSGSPGARDGGGPIADAMAQSPGGSGGTGGGTCCTPAAQTFTKIASGDFMTQAKSGAIPTAGYRELVLYLPSIPTGCAVGIGFRADSSSPFTVFQTFASTQYPSMRFLVQGSDVQLQEVCNGAIASLPWTLAGVNN